MSPAELVGAARALLGSPGELGPARARAVALLTRQALEGAVEARLSEVVGEVRLPFSVALACFQGLEPTDRRRRAVAATWSGLSRACHVHGYELAPTEATLVAWLEDVEALTG